MSVAGIGARTRRPPGTSGSRAPLLLLLPSTVLLLLLLGWPLLVGIGQAFGLPGEPTMAHWTRMAGDPRFGDAVRNTLLLAIVLVPVQFVLATAMALLLWARLRLSGVYFYLWAIPLAVSELAAGLVWLSIFTNNGYLNSLLGAFGVEPVEWLSYQSPTTMFLAVLLAELWRSTSLVMVILVAGLQGIHRDVDEAAQVFGASFSQRLRHVILPLLAPSIQVALILRTILAFEAFAAAQALTGRNFPLLVGETYQWYAELSEPAVASAVGLVVLGISMVTAVVYLRLLRRPEASRSTR